MTSRALRSAIVRCQLHGANSLSRFATASRAGRLPSQVASSGQRYGDVSVTFTSRKTRCRLAEPCEGHSMLHTVNASCDLPLSSLGPTG